MKRSTASWTTAIAASALLAMPVGSWAQQTTRPAAPRQQTGAPSSPSPSADRSSAADSQQGSANEHLRKAQAALADIPAASLTGNAKTRVAELKRHLNTLEQSASSNQAATARSNPATAQKSGNWSTEVAAADRILTELLGATGTTGAGESSTAGTSGSTASAPKTTTTGKSGTSATVDEGTRTKLQEVRTHLTAFATAMSGGSATSTPRSSDDPSSPASASAASPDASAQPSASTSAAPSSGTPGATGTTGSTTTTPAAGDPAAASPQTPAAGATPSPTPSQQVDADMVKRHLTAARDTLSQLTQLPAAAQLTGDARTQVSQLISNFNELITTNTDWRASYAKVQANLTALVGDQRADESPTPTTGAAGAVGTSGTTAVDPAIRAKLVEFRSHLMEFEKAAGGGAQASNSTAAQPADAAASAPAQSQSPTQAQSQAPAASPDPAATAATPAPTGTSGRSSDTTATAGTSGTTAAMPAAGEQQSAKPSTEQQGAKPSTSGQSTSGQGTSARGTTAQAAEGHRQALSHIDAIEAILNGTSATAGTSGTTASKTAKTGTLDRAQIDQIRTHLQQLRRELTQSGGR